MATSLRDALPWLPVGAAIVGVVIAFTTSQIRSEANAAEIEDNANAIEGIEEDIDTIEDQLIRRQGEVELELQRIRIQQQQQTQDTEEILEILQGFERRATEPRRD